MVPSYNLPKLRKVIEHELPARQTLWQAYKEIIPGVIKKSKDPNYSIKMQLPAEA
jgi:fatty acid desaturase